MRGRNEPGSQNLLTPGALRRSPVNANRVGLRIAHEHVVGAVAIEVNDLHIGYARPKRGLRTNALELKAHPACSAIGRRLRDCDRLRPGDVCVFFSRRHQPRQHQREKYREDGSGALGAATETLAFLTHAESRNVRRNETIDG
jgi:hypothetical protein